MPRVEDLLRSVRRISLSAKGASTARQIEAVEQLGLGAPPADMTFGEASALLTARNAAREVLQQLGGKARIHWLIRLQLEPYLIQFIVRDPQILGELVQRSHNRWGFCKDDTPLPTPKTQAKVFREARRLVTGAPYATDKVIRLSRRNYTPARKTTISFPKYRYRRSYSRNNRRRYFRLEIRRSLTVIISLIRPLFFAGKLIKGRASVIDGDTIEIHGQRIRIWGIDAPEDGQLSIKDGRPWRCGQDCANALAAFLGTRTVTCVERGRDEFSRIVATCEVGGLDVGSWLVRNGWALDYKRYSKGRYADEQTDARRALRGLWQGEFEMPWKWRARSRWLLENHSSALGASSTVWK